MKNTVYSINLMKCPICSSALIKPYHNFNKNNESFDYFICDNCYLLFLDPAIENSNYYEKDYIAWSKIDLLRLKDHKFKNSIFYNLLKFPNYLFLSRHLTKNSRILDIGFGQGKLLSKLFFNGYNCFGLEVSRQAIYNVKKQLDITFYSGNLEDQNIPENYFDAINCSQVLEHIRDNFSFLNTIQKILKPGGYLLIDVPVHNSLNHFIFRYNYSGFDIPLHYYLYSENSLNILFNKLNLHIIKKRTMGFYFYNSLSNCNFKLFKNRYISLLIKIFENLIDLILRPLYLGDSLIIIATKL